MKILLDLEHIETEYIESLNRNYEYYLDYEISTLVELILKSIKTDTGKEPTQHTLLANIAEAIITSEITNLDAEQIMKSINEGYKEYKKSLNYGL